MEDIQIQKIVPFPPTIIDIATPDIDPTPIFPAKDKLSILILFLDNNLTLLDSFNEVNL